MPFYVIEGIDGSGKGEQTEELVDWFREEEPRDTEEVATDDFYETLPPGDYDRNIENGVWRMDFPMEGTNYGDACRDYLAGVLGDDVNPLIPLATFAADRKQFADAINTYLENGGIIVADRYTQSHLAYQTRGLEGEEWQERVERIKDLEKNVPQPDAVFYLNVPPEEAAKLREGRDEADDIYDGDPELQQQVWENYNRLAEHEDWEQIDAVQDGELRSIEDIRGEIREKAEKYL